MSETTYKHGIEDIHEPLLTVRGDAYLAVERCDLGHDGDEWGNEWKIGRAIGYCDGWDEAPFWMLYSDDGRGNGDGIEGHPTLLSALHAATVGA